MNHVMPSSVMLNKEYDVPPMVKGRSCDALYRLNTMMRYNIISIYESCYSVRPV